jgi:hypothetical protein
MRQLHRSVMLIVALTAADAIEASAIEAQVALQVRSGDRWQGTAELARAEAVTFRWRWDGLGSPSRAVWQLATKPPASTAITRASDPVAREAALSVPTRAGVYQEFKVPLESGLPSELFVRVRVDIGGKSAFSRWTSVKVLTVAASSANPSCTTAGFKFKPAVPNATGSTTPSVTKTVASGEFVSLRNPSDMWSRAWVNVWFHNRSGAAVSYQRDVRVTVNEKILPSTFNANNPRLTRTLSAGQSVKVELDDNELTAAFGVASSYNVEISATVTPLNGAPSKCAFTLKYKYAGTEQLAPGQ